VYCKMTMRTVRGTATLLFGGDVFSTESEAATPGSPFRNHPRCANYLGIVFREPGRNTPVQVVNGHCLICDYRPAWIVIRGKRGSSLALNNDLSSIDIAN